MESVFVLKIFKNFKNCAILFCRLNLASQSSRKTLVASLLRSTRDSLASQATSHKKDLENFQFFWVFSIFTTHVSDRFVSGSSSREFTQNALRLPLWLTHKWTFLSQKTLRQIFQNLPHGILATWPGDLLTIHSSWEKCVFCTNRVKSKKVFKNFSIFPRITCYFIVLSASPSSKTTIFTYKTSIFFINPSPIFKKRYGFSQFSKYFMFLAFDFLDFVFCWDLTIWC